MLGDWLCGRRQNNSQRRAEHVIFNNADGTSEAATIVHPFVAGVMQRSTSCKQALGSSVLVCGQRPVSMPPLQPDAHPIYLVLEGT